MILVMPSLDKQKERFEHLQYVAKKIMDIGSAEKFSILNQLYAAKKLNLNELAQRTAFDTVQLKAYLEELKAQNFIVQTVDSGEDVFILRDPALHRLLKSIKKSSFFFS